MKNIITEMILITFIQVNLFMLFIYVTVYIVLRSYIYFEL